MKKEQKEYLIKGLNYEDNDIGDCRTGFKIYVDSEENALKISYGTMYSDDIIDTLCNLDFSEEPLDLLKHIKEGIECFSADYEVFSEIYSKELYANGTSEINEDDEDVTMIAIENSTIFSFNALNCAVRECYTGYHLRDLIEHFEEELEEMEKE